MATNVHYCYLQCVIQIIVQPSKKNFYGEASLEKIEFIHQSSGGLQVCTAHFTLGALKRSRFTRPNRFIYLSFYLFSRINEANIQSRDSGFSQDLIECSAIVAHGHKLIPVHPVVAAIRQLELLLLEWWRPFSSQLSCVGGTDRSRERRKAASDRNTDQQLSIRCKMIRMKMKDC